MGDLTNLEQLYLYDNPLAGEIPHQLGNLTNLERLLLHRNQLTGSIPTQLGNLTKLELLYLSGNQLTGRYPTSWATCPTWKRLLLGDNNLNNNPGLTGAIPHQLGNLTKLECVVPRRQPVDRDDTAPTGQLVQPETVVAP